MTTTTPARAKDFVSIEDAARHLRICTKTIRRRIADGTITGYRVGRLIRLDLNEVVAKLATPIPTVGRF